MIQSASDRGRAIEADQMSRFARKSSYNPSGEENMTKTIILSMCLAASSLSLNAHAQDVRQYADGPVTEVDYIQVEYGHFEEYIDWLNSTWKPTMEAFKKAEIGRASCREREEI